MPPNRRSSAARFRGHDSSKARAQSRPSFTATTIFPIGEPISAVSMIMTSFSRAAPETAPGTPAWMGTSAIVSRAMRLISSGALDGEDVEVLAARVGVGARQLRRLFAEHLGAAPSDIARARRVHFARTLIDETDLPFS